MSCNDRILRYLEQAASKNIKLYHGTSESAELIKQTGLKGGRHNAVFLTDNPDLAIEYAESDGDRTGSDNVTLVSVLVKHLDHTKLMGDLDHTLTENWEESLAETDQCMYLADIPPRFIVIEKTT